VPDAAATALEPTDRTTLRRKRDRGSHDREVIDAILDEALVAHVGFAAPHGPVVLPMAHVRIGDDLYLHGAAGNDLLRNLAAGADACVTVTLLDGLVFARSAFHHAVNYRCVVLLGQATRVTDATEMRTASAGLLDHLAPGRSLDARPPTDDELRATLFVRFPILEGSAKVRSGGPSEEPADLDLPVWAGEVPLRLVADDERPHSPDGTPPPTPTYITNHALR